jgi:hypothetical protein
MNWKLILQLSMFGLIMAFGTIALIPAAVEPIFWLIIFIICAYLIAKLCSSKYFLYGFLLSVFNSVWITIAHTAFYSTYASHHPSMEAMLPVKGHVVVSMIIVGILSAVAFGLIQGLFAYIASKLVKKAPVV